LYVTQKFTDCQKDEQVTQKFTDCQKDEQVTQTFTECQSNLECYEINSNRDENRLPIGYMPHAEGRMHSVSCMNLMHHFVELVLSDDTSRSVEYAFHRSQRKHYAFAPLHVAYNQGLKGLNNNS
jgi:hypothetical protein